MRIAEKEGSMKESFLAFHLNAVSSFLFLLTDNRSLLLLLFGVFGILVLSLKQESDVSVREEQRIM